MARMLLRLLRSKRIHGCLILLSFCLMLNYFHNKNARRSILSDIMYEKGTGCDIPQLDPFSPEVTQFDREVQPLDCCGHNGLDWVRCHMSKCEIREYIGDRYTDVVCTYRDVIYESDKKYYLGPEVVVPGHEVYELERSDHVKVRCTGRKTNDKFSSSWSGQLAGYRKMVLRAVPPGRENTINVLIFGFDSTSRTMFIRRMPKSYKMITETLKAHVFEGYNIVGDATVSNLTPLLTGKSIFELMADVDARKKTVDRFPWIWNQLKDDGYRTVYYEDSPSIGTYQAYNGFANQPTDHYLRAFYLENSPLFGLHWNRDSKFCVGDTPSYKLLMNITKDFHKLPGKKFSFTFVVDIVHDDHNMLSLADDHFVEFLKHFWTSGLHNDTLLIVMGDHGSRFSKARDTLTGKLEERLPLLSILLPKTLKLMRPTIDENLRKNVKVLTTSHDLYATVMDALDMREHWNPHRANDADITRGLTLFEPIPHNRSCSEADIEPLWCSCLKWEDVPNSDKLYQKAANSFVDFLNNLTGEVRVQCVVRNLKSISYVQKQKVNARLLAFSYGDRFNAKTQYVTQNYQIKLTVMPGEGVYEAGMEYCTRSGDFTFKERDISRINPYGDEPSCILKTHPHLKKYCYCNNYLY